MGKRIIIAGSGGQGVLFFGKLLAYAAMLEGREVTWFPSYGAEMRGGTANCTVIISDRMIGSPVIRNPDVLVVMNDDSYRRFVERLSPGGILIYDPSQIRSATPRGGIRLVTTPAGAIASSMNNAGLANMALMGAFIAAAGIVDIKSALSALDEITPAHRRELLKVNKDILMKGYDGLQDSNGTC
ncbi:MAG: 2-oxoacid:acceptor oxidoreductase family protein [Nitrospirae bacterium]|nr:2-oxoacid:acceptor oxidoreductase family protein [Nitrospirota bacterium]